MIRCLGSPFVGLDFLFFAETDEIKVAPHNYNGHLSSFQALNFVASVSNVKMMESDPDAVPIRDELFTVLPEIKDGQMTIHAARVGNGAQREGRPRARVVGLGVG